MILWSAPLKYRFMRENPRKQAALSGASTLVGFLTRFLLSFVCYAYPCTIACDYLVLGNTPGILFNLEVLLLWAVLFLLTHFVPLSSKLLV